MPIDSARLVVARKNFATGRILLPARCLQPVAPVLSVEECSETARRSVNLHDVTLNDLGRVVGDERPASWTRLPEGVDERCGRDIVTSISVMQVAEHNEVPAMAPTVRGIVLQVVRLHYPSPKLERSHVGVRRSQGLGLTSGEAHLAVRGVHAH